MKQLDFRQSVKLAIAITALTVAIAPKLTVAQPQPMPADHAPLENDLWYLTSYLSDAGERTSAQSFVQQPSIRFSEGRVGGNATCNRFFGSYRLDEDDLTIQPLGLTRMACPDEFMAQEQRVVTALGQVASYAIANDELQFLNANGDILLTFTKAVPPALTGTLWQLIAYNNGQGSVVSVIAGTNITATFDGNGGLTGFAGCNNYIVSYEATADTIDMGVGVSTRKFCSQPEGVMAQESAYLQALETASTYTIEGNTLILQTSDGATVARFSAVEVVEAS
ncbi:MAG: META domain-containing protein [Elainellaceae cyanobacterium]